ncbi:MAG: transglutaminase-like domain-containing protein, partial [Planctomycetota bacterium]
ARFTMDCYDNFDGWDWDQTEFESDSKYLVDRLIQIEKHFGKPWYVLRNIQRDYLTSHRTHRVKIMRLEDEVLPAPPLLRSWHIYKVDRKGLFHWNKQGLVRMGGEFIAPHTMIDVVSSIPNYYVLRNSKNLSSANQPSTWWDWIDSWLGVTSKPGFRVKSVSPIETDKESPYIQVPNTESRKSLKSLVNKLTDGVPVGWQQIEAITNHFRNEFELDPASTPTEDCEDSVEWFLESKKGPAYLFATAATMALRTAGYRTRYASGYVVTYDDYDRLAGQSYITSDNFHMWPEVSVDGWHWLAVEPTPGYPIPCNTLTLKQRLVSAITFLWTTVFRNPLTTFLSGLLLFFGIRYRKSLLARAGWAGWGLAVFVMPVHRLKLTRKLIDLRFWAANSPRPSFVSPSNWYSKVDADGADDFIRLWQSSYFNPNFDRKSSSQEIYRACREAVKTLTLQRIRSHQNQTTLERTK